MNGQWLGRYSGSNTGTLFINLDDIGTCYSGSAFAYNDDASLPHACAFITTPDRSSACHLCLALQLRFPGVRGFGNSLMCSPPE